MFPAIKKVIVQFGIKKKKTTKGVPYLLRLFTAMQTPSIKASATREATMISQSVVELGEEKQGHFQIAYQLTKYVIFSINIPCLPCFPFPVNL